MLVIDSCVLIHLARIGKLNILKAADACCTTENVYRETVIKGQRASSLIAEAFEMWIEKKSVKQDDALSIAKEKGVEVADATLILLAEQTNGILLTNDRALIFLARSRSVRCMWLTSLLLDLCKNQKLSKEETLQILYDLVQERLNIETSVYALLEKKIKELE